jgi:hypothetical protein
MRVSVFLDRCGMVNVDRAPQGVELPLLSQT